MEINKAVQEYSRLMQIAFDIEGKKVENEVLEKISKNK